MRILPCIRRYLEFWNVREHSLANIWQDFGYAAVMAFMLTGDARATDRICHLSSEHAIAAQATAELADDAYERRRS